MEKADFSRKEHYTLSDLEELIAFLRSPEGCPWDRVQTHESIRNHFVEEAYEVCEGIDNKDDGLLCEELGDVLFQVAFHTGLSESRGSFGMQEVLDGICRKMIRRHPQLFTENGEILSWEEIKRREKGEKSLGDSLSRISMSLPALWRADKFLSRGADPKLLPPAQNAEETIGRALLETVEQAHALGVDPEESLNRTLSTLLKKSTKS